MNSPMDGATQLRFYGDLAPWWPLISAPADYAEEAAFSASLLATADHGTTSVLELGSGGGNNASHLKALFTMTLVDRSPTMLDVSRALNPECEHVEGDMRDVRLGRTFDAVFVHDAIDYMTTEGDLRRAMQHRVRTLPTWRSRGLRTRPHDREVRGRHRPWWPRRA